jgi:NTE family protein
MPWPTDQPIALALSGGGIRAMVFHLGVLARLAERGQLERVTHISSVSGGSLIVGLVLLETGMQWPTSAQFLEIVVPRLREKLCARGVQWGALRQAVRPSNWRYLLSRANLLAEALKNEWQVAASLADLPVCPEWSINATNAENGKRFRFKRENLGDYLTGYASSGGYPLADAMAVSAAFPGGFGPLALAADERTWKKREWDAPATTEAVVAPAHPTLHLYDGGVYDNLGLEPYFDAGRGRTKLSNHFIVVSDAGLPLALGLARGSMNPMRLKRVADIMSDQARALRVRTFVHFVTQAPHRGAFIFIGCNTGSADAALADDAKRFPTTLLRLTPLQFDRLFLHGQHAAENGHGA